MKACLQSSSRFNRSYWTYEMAASKWGRVVLHTLCLLRHPAHARWHWDGIVREVSR